MVRVLEGAGRGGWVCDGLVSKTKVRVLEVRMMGMLSFMSFMTLPL